MGLYVEDEDLVYFEPGSIVTIKDCHYTVSAIRRGKKGPQVALDGVNSRDVAETIRGNDVYASERRDLTEGEFWPDDLVGLEVRPGGGTVIGVAHGVAQDRLVIERGDDSFEVPFVGELIPVVDLSGGYVELVEIEGLSSPSDRD